MKRLVLLIILSISFALRAQDAVKKATEVKEGDGSFTQIIIRGVTLINGTGATAIGPVDIVVRQNRIAEMKNGGNPGMPINPDRRPKLESGGKELDCTGMYLMPGFIDMHGHIGGSQAPFAEYVFKLWMAHGITSIRDPSAGNGLEWVLDQKAKSEKNLITAPRIKAYTAFGMGSTTPISTADQARAWVNENKLKGADGIKFFGAAPDIMDAALRENKKLGLRSASHHPQMDVPSWNVLKSADPGLTSMK